VGDLHVENFGTWRDIEGRLIWGINDFDEACWMPYTIDLVRLAASAHMAIGSCDLNITPDRASKALLDGYRKGLTCGGLAFVLAENHTSLREMAVERLKMPELFWEKMRALPTYKGRIPSSAEKGLRRMMPERDLVYRVMHRVSGMGSLGRRRFVALADWRGGSIARVDRFGILKVGPESAGSRPGPACYGRGGTRVTITDAFAACARRRNRGATNGFGEHRPYAVPV